MNQAEKARQFAALHVTGNPVVLYNIWDAGSANAVTAAGARALATGSWAVAAAQGYSDGQAMPFDVLEAIASRIASAVDVPLSVDFEGGYAERPAAVAANALRLVKAGAVGVNFEDQVLSSAGLYDIDTQCLRIAAIREAADSVNLPLYINARTDLFLKEADREKHASLMDAATARANAYANAGASGFFVPGLADATLIGELCAAVSLPVNVMVMQGVPPASQLAQLGVARISHGPGPYLSTMAALQQSAAEAYS